MEDYFQSLSGDFLPIHRTPSQGHETFKGVNENVSRAAKNNELEAIRHAISQIDPKYAPSFTLVITTKRHNKRFFMGNGDQAANTVPGTVIDRDVTRAGVTQFFMQSHFPLLGTVKMPQYDVLLDEAH
uniref:Piwi domain-containing protein n=1 Tax=Steinernema glaseri TaxID=37863 RepID=A0A1I8AI80_9BILA